MNTTKKSLFFAVLFAAVNIAAALHAQPAPKQPAPKQPAPRLALDAGGHTAMVNQVLFRPDGQELITVSDDKTIRIYDVFTGESLRVLRPPIGEGPQGMLYAAALSPDGTRLAVAGYGFSGSKKAIYLISLSGGEIEKVLTGHSNAILDLAFSPDGNRLASAGGDNTARIWDVESGTSLHVLTGHTQDVYGVRFSPDGQRLATASYDQTAAIWSVSTGKRLAEMKGHTDVVRCIAWSPNGHRIATGSKDQTVRLWDSQGSFVRSIDNLHKSEITSITFMADSHRLFFTQGYAGGKAATGLLNLDSGEIESSFTKHNNSVVRGAISADGKLAATTGGDHKESFIWKTSDGTQLQKLVGKGKVAWSAAWSPDGQSIAWGNTNEGRNPNSPTPLERSFNLNRLEFSDTPDATYTRARVQRGSTSLESSGKTTVDVLRGGTKQHTFQFEEEYDRSYNRIHCFTLLPNDRAVIGAQFGMYLFETRTGKRVRDFIGNTGDAWAVSPSPDGRFILSASNDMTLRIWVPDQDQPLLNLFFAGEEWVAWTPQGYYACSPGGEALMGWHLDNGPDKLGTFAAAAQFRDSLYRPDVIKLLLRTGSVERALEVTGKASTTDVSHVLPPTVVITSPEGFDVKSDTAELTVRAVARQVGMHPITSIQLLLDGRPLGGKAGIKHFDEPQQNVKERFDVPLEPGIKHRIQVRADSAVSYGLSEPVTVTFKPKDNSRQLPSLYVLAIGVKDYANDELDLHYADADAKRLQMTFEKHGKGLFRKVVTKLVVNDEATQRGILTGLDWMRRQMGQGDVGVVYFSGHGDVDSTETFHLLPHDVDPKLLKVTGVSDGMIKDMLKSIQGRLVLMLDACRSGSAFKNSGDFSDNLVRDLVSDDYGVMVMSSSKGRELSQESSDDGGGFFTIAIAEGLSGKADSNNDGVIYSGELALYVEDRVKELTKGNQHPITRTPGNVSAFPLSKK